MKKYNAHINVEVCTKAEQKSYVHNTFFYADGRFTTTVTSDNALEITIYVLSLMPYVVLNLPRSLNLYPAI